MRCNRRRVMNTIPSSMDKSILSGLKRLLRNFQKRIKFERWTNDSHINYFNFNYHSVGFI